MLTIHTLTKQNDKEARQGETSAPSSLLHWRSSAGHIKWGLGLTYGGGHVEPQAAPEPGGAARRGLGAHGGVQARLAAAPRRRRQRLRAHRRAQHVQGYRFRLMAPEITVHLFKQ